MMNKLSFRNMQRSMKYYLIYVMTMSVITAFMYAFSSLFFDRELSGTFEMNGIMEAMIGIATFFIVLIVAWLINYMVKFMLEKRSTEFGIYMLLGMKKKKIADLYLKENFLLGVVAYIPGIAVGILLQQVIMAILSHMVRAPYQFHISFNVYTLLVTSLCYAGCYFLAMFRCRRKFKKMNIYGLMNAGRQNEEIKESHENLRKIIFPISILLLIAFWVVFPNLSSTGMIMIFLIILVIDIYLFYMGLSAWIICYVRKKKDGIYRGQNLFLLRQFASKVKTMQFTMGTLMALFTVALMGASMAMMFSDFQNKLLDTKWPFDVQINSTDVQDDFADEQEIIQQNAKEKEHYIYHIYTNGKDQANIWMCTNLSTYGNMYVNEDGSVNKKAVTKMLSEDGTYCRYDTYMGISDYNHLRQMLGYPEIALQENEYAIHIKARLRNEADPMPEGLDIENAAGDGMLQCNGIYSEPFSQDGHNGGDYVLIVPDAVIQTMQPYYSEMVVELSATAPKDLEVKLDNLADSKDIDSMGHAAPTLEGNSCSGSDNIVVYVATNLVRDNVIPEAKYMLASLIVPGFHIGLVFVCVALTVLSVQQLSDSSKYKRRYDVLGKIGLDHKQINKLIWKQLMAYYLCPAIFAMLISGNVILRISRTFIHSTGVHTNVVQYFGISVLLFFGIYLVYFLATYVGFKRNIYMRNR
ncbi:MAG: ABC transporter permease [Hespellia sp.]|nr:ABC transporter permease [Hespellia sp.]